jgi:hypothetical protein
MDRNCKFGTYRASATKIQLEGHSFHFWQLAFGVRRLNSFGNLVRCLAFHSNLGVQLVQRQNAAAGDGIETDWRTEL